MIWFTSINIPVNANIQESIASTWFSLIFFCVWFRITVKSNSKKYLSHSLLSATIASQTLLPSTLHHEPISGSANDALLAGPVLQQTSMHCPTETLPSLICLLICLLAVSLSSGFFSYSSSFYSLTDHLLQHCLFIYIILYFIAQ